MKFEEFLKFKKINEQEEWFDAGGNSVDGTGENILNPNGQDEGDDDDDDHDDGDDDDNYDDDDGQEKDEVDEEEVREILEERFPNRDWEFTDEDIDEVIKSYRSEHNSDPYESWQTIVEYLIEDIKLNKES